VQVENCRRLGFDQRHTMIFKLIYSFLITRAMSKYIKIIKSQKQDSNTPLVETQAAAV